MLTGGVTLAPLATLRAIPFRVIYIIGLGEGIFPGSDTLSTFDLRSRVRLPGDIRPAETNRFLLMEALLAAREKVYLLYNCKELQKDQVLHPSSAINQLCRHLETRVIGAKFEVEHAPLRPADPIFILQEEMPHSDAIVTYSETDRLLAILSEVHEEKVTPTKSQSTEMNRVLRKRKVSFDLLKEAQAGTPGLVTVSLRELKDFLLSPIEAALKRHLGLEDDDEEAEETDEEPFFPEFFVEYRLVVRNLERFVKRAATSGMDTALQEWRPALRQMYDEWRLRGHLPDAAFGEADLMCCERKIHERIHGANGLASFSRARLDDQFCGPILIGETLSPVGARLRFPALRLGLANQKDGSSPAELRLVGYHSHVWRSRSAVEMLVITNSMDPKKEINKHLLIPFLLYAALRVGTEKGPGGETSSKWIGGLACRVHVAHKEGIRTFWYKPEDLGAEKSMA